jgi:fatty-acyl-CoA synthase
VTLPLYHATGGLCAMGAALLNGGSVLLRKKFSATHFWSDVRRRELHDVRLYRRAVPLSGQPAGEDEHRNHKIRLIFGNGLRPDVWDDMLDRFKVGGVLEFYGATEGNVSLFNFDGRRGAIGRIPKLSAKKFNIRIVKFDVETEMPCAAPTAAASRPRPARSANASATSPATPAPTSPATPTRPPPRRRSCTTSSKRATPGSAPAT